MPELGSGWIDGDTGARVQVGQAMQGGDLLVGQRRSHLEEPAADAAGASGDERLHHRLERFCRSHWTSIRGLQGCAPQDAAAAARKAPEPAGSPSFSGCQV
ncbi:hypothetical protein FHR32_008007 [Streptosporangium album]|uniref:Uncharacterized protein n=1 Tax=Streptosporangium album TaxID=47479 RepID=A0A7W7S4N2_9ACTN|nr:hypothetical protein [Streptosporangium album]MBB4943607.1 hypothetical protein [Streptosporangium album]